MNVRSRTTGRLLAAAQILGLAVLAACTPGYPATLCHVTGDESNPYELIAITGTDASLHLGHPNDFPPAPAGGCPSSPVVVTNATILICHATTDEANPYDEITVSVNGLNGHGTHEGDLFPVPDGGCPTGPVPAGAGASEGKITICHATSSAKNPYNEIIVSVNGLNGHDKHAGDIIPVPDGGCPTP
ncbi:MAG: hypothetical protein V1755_13970 [Chloroflexota bacterium]